MKLKEIENRKVHNNPKEGQILKRKASEDKFGKNHLPKLQQVRFMNKKNGYVKGYSANTCQGLVRPYNQDRISIILNITKPDSEQKWPKCSYFAIFDGHGGSLCSDFLRDNMHQYIIEDKHFPSRPIEAIKCGFAKAETEFRRLAETMHPVNNSGSCAIVILIIDAMCYVANVGDSRAIMSIDSGKITQLSQDHKPNLSSEKQRIQRNGGHIYQSVVTTKSGGTITGPFRIFPGRLSVSRAIGDILAKQFQYSGNPKVLIADPEITHYEIKAKEQGFIFLGCDGIFDKLQNEEVVDLICKARDNCKDKQNFGAGAISSILQQSMNKKSMDNITGILIMIGQEGPVEVSNGLNLKSMSSVNLRTVKDKMLMRQKSKTKEIFKVTDDLKKQPRRTKPLEDKFKENINIMNRNQSTNSICTRKIVQKYKNTVIKPVDQLKKITKKMYEYIRY